MSVEPTWQSSCSIRHVSVVTLSSVLLSTAAQSKANVRNIAHNKGCLLRQVTAPRFQLRLTLKFQSQCSRSPAFADDSLLPRSGVVGWHSSCRQAPHKTGKQPNKEPSLPTSKEPISQRDKHFSPTSRCIWWHPRSMLNCHGSKYLESPIQSGSRCRLSNLQWIGIISAPLNVAGRCFFKFDACTVPFNRDNMSWQHVMSKNTTLTCQLREPARLYRCRHATNTCLLTPSRPVAAKSRIISSDAVAVLDYSTHQLLRGKFLQ